REPFLATVAGFVLLGCILAVLQRNYDSATLDELLQRSKLALEQSNKKDMDAALGGVSKFTAQMRNVINKGDEPPDRNKRLLGGTAVQREQLASALEDFQDKFTNPGGKFEDTQGELKKVHQLGLQLRVSVGSLRTSEKLKLSKFSGAPPAEDVPFYDDGRVKE